MANVSNNNGYVEIRATVDRTLSKAYTLQAPVGTNVNLTGCSAILTAKKSKAQTTGDIILSSTGGSPRITLGGAAGTITILVPKAVTALWESGLYYYDLEIFYADGSSQSIFWGKFDVNDLYV